MVCPLSRWCVCRGHVFSPNTLFLFQAPEKCGSWSFWSLCIVWIRNWPPRCMHAVIFSPMQFLCILLLKERCVQPESQVFDLSFFI